MFLRRVVRPTDLGFLVSYASRVETVQLPTSDIRLLREAADSIGNGAAAIGLHDKDAPLEPRVSLPGGGTVGINGRRIVKGVDKLEAALDEISDELHHQHSLGYYPENRNWDGKFRKIQISAEERGFKVYARKGYYANPPAPKVAAAQ